MSSGPNAGAIQAWDGVLFDKFSRFRHVLTDGLSIHGTEALRRHPPAEGARVLDLGCGFGDATLELAKLIGPRGTAAGVDCAARFVEESKRGASAAGLPNANYFTADVQFEDLRGPYELAFSRFGSMFFASPVAAFRNVKRALTPGGSLLLVVWRKREDNPWIHAAELAVKEVLPPPVEETTEVHCGPGPFSMGSADLVSAQLLAAGFSHVAFERFDCDICIGRDLEDAVAFAVAIGPAGEMLRFAAASGVDKTREVEAALKVALAPFVRAEGVYAPSSTWFVSARAT